MLTYTITQPQDWDALLLTISKEYRWTQSVADAVIAEVTRFRQLDNSQGRIYQVEIDEVRYLNLTVKSEDELRETYEYEVVTINLETPRIYPRVYVRELVVVGLGICVIGILAYGVYVGVLR